MSLISAQEIKAGYEATPQSQDQKPVLEARKGKKGPYGRVRGWRRDGNHTDEYYVITGKPRPVRRANISIATNTTAKDLAVRAYAVALTTKNKTLIELAKTHLDTILILLEEQTAEEKKRK